MSIDAEALARLRSLLAKATPGPWDCGSGAAYEPATNIYCDDSLGSIVATCAHSHNIAITRKAETANAALIVAMRKDIEALLDIAEAVQWQPIETAPKDARVVLFCDHRGNRWSQTADCRVPVCGHPPVCWTQLPAPPAVVPCTGGGE